jgi:hypothetical protein
MTETPNLQTVLTLTAGVSSVPQSQFVWGTPVRPFSVGSRGDWVVDAPGVEPVHLFLQFDGKMIHVAGGPTGAVQLSGAPVDQTWRPVPVFSEVTFGAARLRVTCEPAPARSPSEAPRVVPAAPRVLEPQPALNSTAPLGTVRRLKTEPLVLPGQGGSTEPTAPPVVRESGSYPPAGGQNPAATLLSPRGSQPPFGAFQPPAGASQPPFGAAASPAGASQPPFGAFQPPIAGSQPLTAGTLVSPRGSQPPAGASQPPHGASPAEMREVPSVRQELPSEGELNSTLSDAGALKDHAKRVASEPKLTQASTDAYLEQVRKAAATYGASPPPHLMDALRHQAPGHAAPDAAAPFAPAAFAAGTPPTAQAPLPATANEAPPDPNAKKEKPKTSWVMRVTLLLLPIAGYFAIFWDPPRKAPPPPDVTASTPAASAPLASGTPAASGTPSATSSATSAGPANASSSPSGPPSAAVASAASSPASASSSAAPRASSAPSASVTVETVAPTHPHKPRDALNAAFEGKFEESLAHYDALASGPGGEVYASAARHLRDRAFRKP